MQNPTGQLALTRARIERFLAGTDVAFPMLQGGGSVFVDTDATAADSGTPLPGVFRSEC